MSTATASEDLRDLVQSASDSFARATTPADLENAKAQFLGKAVFEPQPDGTSNYRECGTLLLRDGRELSSHRSYTYRPSERGFTVAFADGPTDWLPLLVA